MKGTEVSIDRLPRHPRLHLLFSQSGPTNSLPYRVDLLERQSWLIGSSERLGQPTLPQRWVERVLPPSQQTLTSRHAISEADVVLAMFESEGHFLALLRAIGVPWARQPGLVVIACWLSDLLGQASPLKRWLYRRLYRSVDRVVVFSENQALALTKGLRLDAGTVVPVTFGVDHELFEPSAATDDDGFVLAAGRDRGRDWPTLAKAAHLSGLPIRLLTRPSDVPPSLPPNVEVLGYVPFDEYRRQLLSARVVVVPTHERAYPTGQTVLLEAMAAGKATVVTQTAAMAEYIEPTRTLSVPPKDPEALAEAMVSLMNDPSERQRLGHGGREFVGNRANARQMWADISAVLESVRR